MLVLVPVQVTLGHFGHGMTFLAFLHGINALLLFAAAYLASRVATPMAATPTTSGAPVGATRGR